MVYVSMKAVRKTRFLYNICMAKLVVFDRYVYFVSIDFTVMLYGLYGLYAVYVSIEAVQKKSISIQLLCSKVGRIR